MSKELRRWQVVKVNSASEPDHFLIEVKGNGVAPALHEQLVPRESREQLKDVVRDEQFQAEAFIFDRVGNERRIVGALRMAIDAHGPISSEWIGSAAKRIEGVLRGAYRNRKADLGARDASE